MRGDLERVDFDCPHCGMGFSVTASDALYESQIEEETCEKCQHCGEYYQLEVELVDIVLGCIKAPQFMRDKLEMEKE